MTGTREALDGEDATVRVTWEPVSASEFRQSWELSRDAGGTWAALRTYRFIRQ